MGMYTQLHLASTLKPDTPIEVIETLKYMLGDSDLPPTNLEHPLFNTERWVIMLRCDSYYFDTDTRSTLRMDHIGSEYVLNVMSNFKNYDSEIDLFLEWIDPHLDKYEGEFLGYSRYEEFEQPNLIFKKKEAVPKNDLPADLESEVL